MIGAMGSVVKQKELEDNHEDEAKRVGYMALDLEALLDGVGEPPWSPLCCYAWLGLRKETQMSSLEQHVESRRWQEDQSLALGSHCLNITYATGSISVSKN